MLAALLAQARSCRDEHGNRGRYPLNGPPTDLRRDAPIIAMPSERLAALQEGRIASCAKDQCNLRRHKSPPVRRTPCLWHHSHKLSQAVTNTATTSAIRQAALPWTYWEETPRSRPCRAGGPPSRHRSRPFGRVEPRATPRIIVIFKICRSRLFPRRTPCLRHYLRNFSRAAMNVVATLSAIRWSAIPQIQEETPLSQPCRA